MPQSMGYGEAEILRAGIVQEKSDRRAIGSRSAANISPFGHRPKAAPRAMAHTLNAFGNPTQLFDAAREL
jgi:hypothetical protein